MTQAATVLLYTNGNQLSPFYQRHVVQMSWISQWEINNHSVNIRTHKCRQILGGTLDTGNVQRSGKLEGQICFPPENLTRNQEGQSRRTLFVSLTKQDVEHAVISTSTSINPTNHDSYAAVLQELQRPPSEVWIRPQASFVLGLPTLQPWSPPKKGREVNITLTTVPAIRRMLTG